jgi:hypothetical protein
MTKTSSYTLIVFKKYESNYIPNSEKRKSRMRLEFY